MSARTGLLADILSAKGADVAALKATTPGPSRREPLDVVAALRRGTGAPLRLIAEVKLRSPSAGPLSRALSPADRALAYAQAGASMVSVLCDGHYFEGSWDHLAQARARLDAAADGRSTVPLLAKEFVIDERQLDEARARGADAVLLIARVVSAGRLTELTRAARGLGLEPLLEVVDEGELEAALKAGARLIGVNARDLDILHMDASRAARVLAAIPRDVVAVRLSGLKTPADVAAMAVQPIDAALMGEALMRQDDPRELLGAMVRAAAG